jgi:hypothetical protein
MKSVHEMTVFELRSAFGRCADCSHKQIGLRRLRDYLALRDRNPTAADYLLQQARLSLANARAYK